MDVVPYTGVKKEGAALQQVDAGEGGGNGKEGRGSAGLGVHAASIFKLLKSFFRSYMEHSL